MNNYRIFHTFEGTTVPLLYPGGNEEPNYRTFEGTIQRCQRYGSCEGQGIHAHL